MSLLNNRRNRIALTLAAVVLVALAGAGCTTERTPLAEAQAPETVPISPLAPVTEPVTLDPTTAPPTTAAPTTEAVTTASTAPVTDPPATEASVTQAPVTEAPVTEPPATEPPPTDPPVTDPPATEAPTTTSTLPPNLEFVGAFQQPIVAVGSSDGPDTQVIQLRLLQLGFWHSGADGEYGLTTKQAVMAFQKYVALPATGKVDEATATWMTALDTKAHGLTDSGTLVEVDKGRQLIFFVVDGKTQWVFNTSTGNGKEYSEEDKNSPGEIVNGVALTPDGLWNVDRERPEGWWEGDLGQIYRPKYFHGGIAIHGSNSVPNYPASHGCVRVTVQAMDFIWANNMMPMDITVWVHP